MNTPEDKASSLMIRASFRQRGFTLLEVMIALLIFSIGLLSAAALQGVAKRANYEAIQRTTATQLAFDLLERMRANANGLNWYVTGKESVLQPTLNPPGAAPAPDCQTRASACDARQLAQRDLWEWQSRLLGALEARISGGTTVATGGLVDPTACIRAEEAGGGATVYTVAIAWRGVTPIPVPAGDERDDCGAGAGIDYDDTEAGADAFRRVVVFQSFVSSP
jgi:type IV pilus assembly protein PilV